MDQAAIFGPFFTMLVLTVVVWIVMFARRIPFLQSSGITPEELVIPGKLAEISPPEVAAPSDNLKNLFELPVLFYALVVYLFVTGSVDGVYVGAAWTFAAFRVLHSAVHCTFNAVMVRFTVYAIAALALWFMVGRALFQHATG